MRSFALASGSHGNSFYVETQQGTKILVDIGLSYARTKSILDSKEVDITTLDALFITHEHGDHTNGLQTFLKQHPEVPLYCSTGTADALGLDTSVYQELKHHDSFTFHDARILAIEKSHDAQEALSFVFSDSQKKIGIFTDIGTVNDELLHLFKTLDILYLEANYCQEIASKAEDLSITYLNRLMSDSGHLGVQQVCATLKETAQDFQTIVLSHISENTNTYTNAYLKTRETLRMTGKAPTLLMSFQSEPTEWIE